MNPGAITALSFSLLALVGTWFIAFHLMPDLRADRLRYRLALLHDEAVDSRAPGALLALLEAASERAEVLSLTLLWLQPAPEGQAAEPCDEIQQRMKLAIARHIAFGCPLLWPRLLTARRNDPGRLVPYLDRLQPFLTGPG